MKIKVFDTENNEFVEKFVIDQDGNVMVGDDYCGACDQPKYSTVEQPLLLRWLPDNMPDESQVSEPTNAAKVKRIECPCCGCEISINAPEGDGNDA